MLSMVSETAKKLVLLVLELAGEYIETDTRMQKLAFLVTKRSLTGQNLKQIIMAHTLRSL